MMKYDFIIEYAQKFLEEEFRFFIQDFIRLESIDTAEVPESERRREKRSRTDMTNDDLIVVGSQLVLSVVSVN